jgi:hypothetical protein
LGKFASDSRHRFSFETSTSFGFQTSSHMASRHVNKQAYYEGSYKVHLRFCGPAVYSEMFLDS